MWCLKLHPSLLPMHAKLKPQQQHTLHATKLLWLTDTEASKTAPKSQHFPSPSPSRTRAIPHYIVVAAATSPPKSSDMSVFLPVSAVLLSFYFIANFIVPELITKYFGFDKVNEDQKVDDGSAIEDK